MSKVIAFPTSNVIRSPIAHYIRIGETAHRRIHDLYAAGVLKATDFVIDASKFEAQEELINDLQEDGANIVLDTKAAELAAPRKITGVARHTPWAGIGEGSVLGPECYKENQSRNIFGEIARFCVEKSIGTVLAPTHYLGDKNFDGWLEVDINSVFQLRRALDIEGGKDISIDYPLIIPQTKIRSVEARGLFLGSLSDLPFENLWIRGSGLGGYRVTPSSLKKFIMSLSSMHNIGKPIIADQINGLSGLATIAFGAVSGISHGIGERESFSATDWHKTEENKGEFRKSKRIQIPTLDRSFTEKEINVLSSARGAKRLIYCSDRECCPSGMIDKIKDPRRHIARQSLKKIEEIRAIPDHKRAEYFLDGPMEECVKLSNQVKKLKPDNDVARENSVDPIKLMERLDKHSQTKENIKLALESLYDENNGKMSRAIAVNGKKITKQLANESKID